MRQPAGRSCRARFHRRQVPRTFRRGRPANLFRHTLRAHRLRRTCSRSAASRRKSARRHRRTYRDRNRCRRSRKAPPFYRSDPAPSADPKSRTSRPAVRLRPTSKNPARAGRISALRRPAYRPHCVHRRPRRPIVWQYPQPRPRSCPSYCRKDTSHNFVVFGLRQRNSIPTGSSIPDFRGFGAAG